jgi:hypothetical protein
MHDETGTMVDVGMISQVFGITFASAIVWGVIALFVVEDAARRERNELVWGGLVFLFGLFGLLLYAVVPVIFTSTEDVTFR